MNLEVLTPKQKRVYIGVTDYLKNNPGSTNQQAFRAVGTNHVMFYKARKILAKQEGSTDEPKKRKYKKRKQEMQTLVVPEHETTLSSGFVIAMVGSPNTIVQSLRDLMK